MARFNRMRYDYRGPEFDRRYGRYEGAFARRFALERWEREREPPRRRRRGPYRRRPLPPSDKEFAEDQAYSRRYWPPAEAPDHRMY